MATTSWPCIPYPSASHSRRQAETGNDTNCSAILNNVPPEIWLCVAQFLELSDQASLSLACKGFAFLLGGCWTLLKNNQYQRLLFLQRLDSGLSGHRFCSGCLKYHLRDLDEEGRWIRHHAFNPCGERNIPLGNGRYLHWGSVQLGLRALHYRSLNYGASLEGLPTHLKPTPDDHEDIVWQHHLQHYVYQGRLIVILDSFRQFHGDPQRLSQYCRGYFIEVENSSTGSFVHVRRLIDAAAVDAWIHPQPRGWNPTLKHCDDWHSWSSACCDSEVGLPGLHWTELSLERRAFGLPEWSNWRFDNETGEPIDPRLARKQRPRRIPPTKK